jgi:hypothetical protein
MVGDPLRVGVGGMAAPAIPFQVALESRPVVFIAVVSMLIGRSATCLARSETTNVVGAPGGSGRAELNSRSLHYPFLRSQYSY